MSARNDLENNLSELAKLGAWIQSNNWCPATSGNLSTKIQGQTDFWISVSGKYKGELGLEDFIQVSAEGEPIKSDKSPSAETLLHSLIYQRFPSAHYVLHTHSVYGTVLGQCEAGGELRLNDYELQKAFKGIGTHEGDFVVPVFPNSQNMVFLSDDIEGYFEQCSNVHCFLLAGHGLYTWGETSAEAKRHLEALEFLFECEYKLRLLKKGM